jgi:hypothetical protein
MAQPSFGEWIRAAKPQNPEASDRELADYYRTTYGGGPTEDDYQSWAERARATVPDEDISDEELRGSYTRRFGDIEQVSDVSRALSDAWSEAKGLGGGLVGLAGETLGLEGVRDWGLKTYEENMRDVAARQRNAYEIDYLLENGTPGDWVDALQYHGVKGLTSLIGGLGTGLVARAGAKAAVKRGLKEYAKDKLGREMVEKAGKRGLAAGVTGYATGQELGSVYPEAAEEAERVGGEVDLAKVYGYGTAAGAVEGLSNLALLGLAGMGKYLPEGLRLSGLAPGGGRFAKAGKALAGSVVTEAGEEALQNPLEYLGANKELGTDEFWAEQRQSIFAGAAGGLGAGGLVVLPHLLSPRALPAPETDGDTNQEKPGLDLSGQIRPGMPIQEAVDLQQPGLRTEPRDEKAQKAAEKKYAQEFEAAFNEPSGITAVDPETQVERELSMGEALQRGLKPEPKPVAETTAPEPLSTAEIVNRVTGVSRETTGKKRGEAMAAAFNEPSGERTVDPATGIERELTAGEALHRRLFGTLPEPVKSDNEQLLESLSDEGRASAVNKQNPKTPMANVRKLWSELQTLSMDTPEDEAETRAFFKEYDAKANSQKRGKSAHAMDELVIQAKERLGIETTTPEQVVLQRTPKPATPATEAPAIATDKEANAAFVSLADEVLNTTEGITAEETTALKLLFGIPVEGVTLPDKHRVSKKGDFPGMPSYATVAKAMSEAGLGVKPNRQAGSRLVLGALAKVRKSNKQAAEIFGSYVKQAEAIRSGTLQTQQLADEIQAEPEAAPMSEQIEQQELGTDELDTNVSEGQTFSIVKGTSGVSLGTKGDEKLAENMVGEGEAQINIMKQAKAARAAEEKLLEEAGAEDLAEVPLTPEEQAHLDMLEEQERIKQEAMAAANADKVDARTKKAQQLWEKSVEGVAWADLHEDSQDGIIGFMAAIENMPSAQIVPAIKQAVQHLRNEHEAGRVKLRAGAVAPETNVANTGTAAEPIGEVTEGQEPAVQGEPDTGPAESKRAPVVTVKRRRVAKPADESFGAAAEQQSADPVAFENTVKAALGRKSNWRVKIYATPEEALADGISEDTLGGYGGKNSGRVAYGWVRTEKGVRVATFIASRIPAGRELSTFMHEVGVHIGLEGMLKPEQLKRMSQQVLQWSEMKGDSVEILAAKRAKERTIQGKVPPHKIQKEMLAYFVEEAVRAGVEPTQMQGQKGAMARLFNNLWQAFQRALHKLGIKPEVIGAQEFVDMALGAAHAELSKGAAPEVETTTSFGDMDEDISFGQVSGPSIKDKSAEAVRAAVNRVPSEFRPAVRAITDTVRSAAQKTITNLAFLKDLGDYVEKKIPALKPQIRSFLSAIQATKVERVKREKEVTEVLDKFQKLPNEKGNKQRDAVNTFLLQSRLDRAWGYVPAWKTGVTVDPKMAKQFNAMSPEAQEVVREVHRVMHDNLMIKNQLINKRITDTFDARIAAAKTADEKAQIQQEKDAALKAFGRTLTELDGPYSPLKRHGRYIVQAYSPEMAAAHEAKDWAKVEELRLDPAHYALEFVESRLEARKREQALAQEFGGNVEYWEKAQWRDHPVVGLHEVERLRSYIAGRIEDETTERNRQLLNMAEDLALRVMSEEHARQSAQHSGDIRGADKDMIRSFVVQGRADAHYIANLNHLAETNDAVNGIASFVESTEKRSKTGLGRDEITRLTNSLYWHWGKTMDYQETPVVDRLAAISSAWYLLFSPAYYFQNATQVMVMSVPWMAGRFGWNNTMRETGRAYADIKPLLFDETNETVGQKMFNHFDLNRLEDPEIRGVVQELLNRGVIDITMDFELGQVAQTGEGIVSQAQQKFDQTMRRLPAKVETINRVVTAIAAYRLSRDYPDQKYPGRVKAREHSVNYAAEVVRITHGDYGAEETPKFISPKFIPGAKVLFQFRKFQLIQLAYLARMFNDAFAGESPDVQRVARRQLLFTFAHFGAIAGGLGLPGMAFIQSLIGVAGSMFGDDDEPWDSDAQVLKFRQAATNMGLPQGMIDILTNGLPTALGMNLTSRLGAQNVVSILPYIRADVRDYDSYEKMLAAALGPSASLGKKVLWGGGSMVAQGDYYKALEAVLPNGLKHGLQAVRIATEGDTTFNGDVVMTPEEIGLWNTLQTALGLSSPAQQKRFEKQRLLQTYQDTFNQRTSDLKRMYAEAKRDKDTDRMGELRAEWQALQAKKREHGFKTAPLSDMLKAPVAQLKRERNVEGGVMYNRGNQAFVNELTRVYGE